LSWQRFAPKEYTDAHFHVCFGKGGLADKKISFITEHVIVTKDGHQFKVDTLVTHNLIIEHYGESHERERRREKDAWRKSLLEKDGFKVLEFWDSQVKDDFDGVINQILEFLKEK